VNITVNQSYSRRRKLQLVALDRQSSLAVHSNDLATDANVAEMVTGFDQHADKRLVDKWLGSLGWFACETKTAEVKAKRKINNILYQTSK
jgi:hypothetical protein